MAGIVQTAKNTIAENFGGAHGLAPKEHQFTLEETPDLSGKVAVITGGTAGIGLATTSTFLSHNISKVILISSSQDSFNAAKSTISSSLGESFAAKLSYYECDVSDWTKVLTTARKIAKDTDRIDILVEDAARGIMTYQVTEQGVDRHMATNHMGHVILTSTLLPVLKKTASSSAPVRIVALGSNAHQGTPSDCKFASIDELNTDLGPNPQYGRSKLAVMLYAKYLSKHLSGQGILANSVHPGFVETKMSVEDIHEPYPIGGYAMSVGMAPFKKDMWDGAVSVVFAATKTDKGGQYICPPAIPEAGSKLYQDDSLMESLMDLTKKIVQEKTIDPETGKGLELELY